MSRTARLHAVETRRESDAGTPLLPRSVLRAASDVGTGTRATLPPVAQKGRMMQALRNRHAFGKPPTGARDVGPMGIAQSLRTRRRPTWRAANLPRPAKRKD